MRRSTGWILLFVVACGISARDADVDFDGYVDVFDVTRVASCAGVPPGTDLRCARADVNRDGVVDTQDFASVYEHFGAVLFDTTPTAYAPGPVVAGSDGTVYLLAADEGLIRRWSSAARRPLEPIRIGGGARHLAYDDDEGMLYVAYTGGRVTRIDTAFPLLETVFLTLSATPDGLLMAGDYLFVAHFRLHETYARDGSRVASRYAWTYASRDYRFSETDGRVYHFRDGISPNDLHWTQIDPATGRFLASGESPYHGGHTVAPPIRVARDGSLVLLGSGNLYDSTTLGIVDSLSFAPADALWLDGGELLTLREQADGTTLLEHWSPDRRLYNLQVFAGSPLRVLRAAAGVVVAHSVAGVPTFEIYVPTDDADGDGVTNDQDGFPLDPAASLDSDGDGYPDSWNPGSDASDSTDGLILDAFPFDSACQLPQHAHPQDPALCDIARGVPAYTPQQTVVDVDGTIYLLSPENDRIYRWSLATDYHLNPIDVGDDPRWLAYSEDNRSLYLAYANGAITRIDLADPSLREVPFASTPSTNQGLQTAGSWIFAVDPTGAWSSHYTFAADGTQISAVEWNRVSRVYEWSAANDRMYFFRDGTSPNDIHWEGIDPSTGVITGKGETPYHGSVGTVPPIRVSSDGALLVTGAGDFHDALTLERAGSLPHGFTDALWLADGSLVTIRNDAGETRLEHWGSDRRLYNLGVYPGVPLRLLESVGEIAVVTLDGGQPAFAAYVPTDDADSDGVTNAQDAFPLDPAASVDSDGDGHPDAWNPGYDASDSTDGLVLDAFPFDSACQLPQHALPGDPATCDVARAVPSYVPDRVVIDEDGVVYLLSTYNDRIYRWSLTADYHLNPIDVGDAPLQLAYSALHDRLYLAYASGEITQIDLTDPSLVETSFATTPGPNRGLQTADPYVFAVDPSGAWNSHYTFASDGSQISAVEWNRVSRVYEWSAANDRMYFFRDGTSPNDIHWEGIDPVTGAITGGGETPYHGSVGTIPPIRVSQDGSRLITGAGDLHDAISLDRLQGLPFVLADALWLSDGSLVTIRDVAGTTHLEQWGSDLKLYNLGSYPGTPLRLLESGGEITVVTLDGGQPAFAAYVPTDDADGDGVTNAQDAFPLDPAASVDSDGDGHPDAWNPGYDASDSTDGLVLDAFPFDSACQLASHGLPSDPSVCDIALGIPSYVPEQVVMDAAGTIYLLSPENDRIYRWSLAADYHLNPIDVGDDPRWLAYSPSHDALYLGYTTGAITRIDLADPQLHEQPFATTPGGILGLQAAGPWIFSVDPSGAWSSHYTFAPDGTQISAVEWNRVSRVYEWSAANDRMYFFRDGTSPNDIHWEGIDPATGAITGKGETPYHGSVGTIPPIRVSQDGSTLVTGAGDFHDAITLDRVDSLPFGFSDARWLADGTLVTIRDDGGRTLLEQWSADRRLYNLRYYDGMPLALLRGTEITVVTLENGQPAFAEYVPTDDADGDGVTNAQDAFPLDPAASVDSDGDGHPDAWNPGYDASDSTDGLVLDAFPFDSACQLASHGLPSDPSVCDIALGIPSYVPEQVVMDAAGTIYLLSPENDRIYRWSLAADYHLNPIDVGDDPRWLAHSQPNGRLYLGYASGAITEIDVTDPELRELPFATVPGPLTGLQTAGRFVFAVDPSGAWSSHYTFAPDGTRISAVEWNRVSRVYEWSAANDRMYFFRDGTSPNDIHWEGIDPVTGAITGKGETPYHGNVGTVPPIRVSPDGAELLTGGGDVHDAITLDRIDKLPDPLTDAVYDADLLLTVRGDGAGGTLVEQWSADRTLYNTSSMAGDPLRVLAHAGRYVVIGLVGGKPFFADYVPTDDGDGDGVVNDDDAFPLDPAASQDSDIDGYPDAWHPGYGPQDSPLVVDAFPFDFACQLPAHGVNGVCDFRSVLPDDAAEPFCSEDVSLPSTAAGSHTVSASAGEFLPLCDGWVFYADYDREGVAVDNVVLGRAGAFYDLPSGPAHLELDEARKRLYASLPDQNAVAAIDLLTGDVNTIQAADVIQGMGIGPGGGLFVRVGGRYSGDLYWLPPGGTQFTGGWPVQGTLLQFNFVRGELVTAHVGLSPSSIHRYAWHPVTGPALLQARRAGGNGQSLAVSPDGQHVALASGGGNGSGYTVFDFDAADLDSHRGEWVTSHYPSGVAFDGSSTRLLATNRRSMLLFDVATFQQLRAHSSSSCDTYQVGFSRGDRIALGMSRCGYSSYATRRIDWFLTP